MGFDGILSSQRDAAEDDEDEDEVSEVGMVDEVVAGDPQAENEQEKPQREEVFIHVRSDVRLARSRGEVTSPVFLSQDEKGASIRDGDDLLFGPGEIGLQRSHAYQENVGFNVSVLIM